MLSIDGVGAYDHVHRSAMLSKLLEVPSLQPLLPVVRAAYSVPSCYKWQDDEGNRHDIEQHEGGEQGDPLMPLLFSLAIHNALAAVKEELEAGEMLFAFLDDIYVLSRGDRTRTIYNLLAEKLQAQAGIQLHAGKTRTWNKSGAPPPDVDDLGPDVWHGEGIKILGTPVGSDAFVQTHTDERLEEENRLWEAIGWVPDAQCAWQILLQCAGPRCHHFIRTLPPSQSAMYSAGHDVGMRRAMRTILGRLPGDVTQQEVAERIATLPMRLGGLGLRSSDRTVPAAYWASWADALPMLSRRLPELTTHILNELAHGPQGCLAELTTACGRLDRSGFVSRPGWPLLRAGERPPPPRSTEPGEWQHGWQFHASSSLEYHFRETVLLAQSCSADQAHLRSHSGPGAGEVLLGAPTGPEFRVEPQLFRTLVLERLRLPLDVTESKCECGCFLDTTGRHRAACPRSGRLRTRAVGPERTLARVCREAGATVRINTKLRDMNVAISASDAREIEVLASGLPLHHGAQLAVDITVRSALTANGSACPNAAHTDGAVLLRARTDKERKYHELLDAERCRLVVVGLEVGGRWSTESVDFVTALAGVQVTRSTSTSEGFGLLRLAAKMDEDVVHFLCKIVCEFAGLDPSPFARRSGWVGA